MGVPTPSEIAYMHAHASDSRKTDFILGSVIPLALASIAFTARFVSRKIGGVRLGAEDWLVVVGMFLTTAGVVSLLVALRYGLGRHIIFVSDRKGFAISILFRYVLYPLSIAFTKLSLLAFYTRIFPNRWLRTTCLCLAIFILAATTTKVMGDIFQCLPVDSAWNPTPHKRCINFVSLVLVSGVLNIVTDFIILALPMPILWTLKLTKTKKWELSGLFLAGGAVCVISVVRLPIVQALKSNDPSWDLFGPLTISAVESCAAIIAACIPTYRPLFSYLHRSPRSKRESRSSQAPVLRRTNSSSERSEMSTSTVTVAVAEEAVLKKIVGTGNGGILKTVDIFECWGSASDSQGMLEVGIVEENKLYV